MERLVPVSIKQTPEKTLAVTWNDGSTCVYSMPLLRKNCPCASCETEKLSKGPFYIPLFAGNMLKLERIEQQGNYAIQLFWKDGHHTGIYDFAYLRKLCPENVADSGPPQ